MDKIAPAFLTLAPSAPVCQPVEMKTVLPSVRAGAPASRLLGILTLVLWVSLAAQGYEIGDVPFLDDFENGTQTSNTWSSDHLYTFDSGYAGSGIRMTCVDSNSAVYIDTTLPADLKGYAVYLSAWVKGEDISPKPNHWNGVKCMMVHQTSEGETIYPQADAGTGTFDWTNVACLVHLPSTVTNIRLVLGLEKVSGTVWFDDVRVKVVALDNRAPLRPGRRPYRGHSLPRLRGAMVPTTLTPESLRTFAQEWKGNLIRWQLGQCTYSAGLETPDYDSILEAELDQLDAMLPVCQSNGVKVVVDLHTLSVGLMKSAANQTKFKEVWSRIATRYRKSPFRDAIWGYDLANEPNAEEWREGALFWNDLAEQTAQLVREIDPTMPIIVESLFGSPRYYSFLRPLAVSNVLYSVHMYEPGPYTHQNVLPNLTNTYTYPGTMTDVPWGAGNTHWDRAALEYALQPVLTFASNYSVHIYVGEFSAVRWAPGASNYLSDCIAIFEERGWDWSYHAFREWQGWDTEYGDVSNDLTHPVSSTRQTVLRQWYAFNERDPYGTPFPWTIRYFGATNAPGSGAMEDPDRDGMVNWREYVAGTVPTNAQSVLKIEGIAAGLEAEMALTWSSATARWYTVQASTDLLAGFSDVTTDSLPASPPYNTHTVLLDQAGVRFYRVAVEP